VRPPRRSPASNPPASPRGLALRLLARRDYTAYELTHRLVTKGVTEDEAARTVERLVEERFIDDRRAAGAHVRTASRIKGRGPRRIRLELEARGIDRETARDLTAEISDEEIAQALDRIVTRKHPVRPIPAEARQRLFRQLLARGFPADAITRALK
jgi:regulatory protein